MNNDIEKVLYTSEKIQERVNELAREITRDYKGKKVLLVCVLRGAVLFFSDIARAVDLDVRMDFMVVSSYGAGTSTSGEIRIVKDLTQPIEGMNVIIVEDIIDTGRTLKHLKNMLMTRNPESVKICSLLDKPERREVELLGDYVGFTVPNEFVVGYGLDYDEKYRNLPYVGVLKKEVYSN